MEDARWTRLEARWEVGRNCSPTAFAIQKNCRGSAASATRKIHACGSLPWLQWRAIEPPGTGRSCGWKNADRSWPHLDWRPGSLVGEIRAIALADFQDNRRRVAQGNPRPA